MEPRTDLIGYSGSSDTRRTENQRLTAARERIDRQARLERLERKLGRRRDRGLGWAGLLNLSALTHAGSRWLRQLSPRWHAS